MNDEKVESQAMEIQDKMFNLKISIPDPKYLQDWTAKDALAFIAEESTELAKAAMKMNRALGNGPATPVYPEQALGDMLEEIADVLLTISVLFATSRDELPSAIITDSDKEESSRRSVTPERYIGEQMLYKMERRARRYEQWKAGQHLTE